MSKNLLNRYLWIVETIRRHGAITRKELNRLWAESDYGDGHRELPRRTFYNYRLAIEDLLGVKIEHSLSTNEYYIAETPDSRAGNVTDWMLSSVAMSSTLTEARSIADRIFLEDVPSAREFLPRVITAMKELHTLDFKYLPFTRSGSPKAVKLQPYFLKIFKLRWYVTGLNVKEGKIKTYALDRISDLVISDVSFTIPADFDAEAYFADAFGIVFTHGITRKVTLKVESSQARYFRALPLHRSQSEMVGDGGFSYFTYHLRLTPDFVEEILSHGPKVTVVAPPELKAMVVSSLKESLKNYES